MVSERMYHLGAARSVIRDLFEYGNLRKAAVGEEKVFDFSLGNPSVPPPAAINENIIRLLHESPASIHALTDPRGEENARAAVIASLNSRFGTCFTADDIILTAGASAAMSCVFRSLYRQSGEVLTFAPYFSEYTAYVGNAKLVIVPADDETLQINFPAFEMLINENTMAVIINSPNNPSGVVYSRETLQRLAAILEERSRQYGHPIYIVSDEPYREIVFFGVQVPWIPDIYRDTIICYSFSKALSLPGERFGYVLIPPQVTDARLIYAAVLGAAKSLGYINAPSLFQQVIAHCAHLTADISVYRYNCELLVRELRAMGYEMIPPDGTFYLFPRSLEPDDIAFCERAKTFDLLLVHGTSFGAPGHFRLAFCVPTEMIERALPRFRALAETYR